MNMFRAAAAASTLVLALVLAGCSNSTKKEFGLEANPPDAFQVGVQPPLSLPPELVSCRRPTQASRVRKPSMQHRRVPMFSRLVVPLPRPPRRESRLCWSNPAPRRRRAFGPRLIRMR